VSLFCIRKNKPQGSRLVRRCWCQQSRATCPIHALGDYVKNGVVGSSPFGSVTPAAALKTLRVALGSLGVEQAELYRCHDFRRGHALDLQASGAPLAEILAAGEWRSPAFLSYLDLQKLETDLVVQAHCDESDGDEVL